MADPQNPIQDDTSNSATTLAADDLLGDISISIPDAPSISAQPENSPTTVADAIPLEDVALDIPAVSPEIDLSTEITAPLNVDMPAISPEQETIPTDTTNTSEIDFGGISLNEETAPMINDISPAEDTATPSQDDFSSISLDIPGVETPSETTTTSVEIPEIALPTEPTISDTNSDLPELIENIDLPEAPSETIAEATTPEETPELPTASIDVELPNTLPTEQPATTIATPTLPEVANSQVDNLLMNEQSQLTNPAQLATSESDMTLDLDSLTSDIAAATPVTDPTAPIVASVILPTPTTAEQTKQHSSSKKSVVVLFLLFLVLLGVGGFVFKTMMPDEANKILASILGTQEAPISTPIITIPTTTTTGESTTGESDQLTGEALTGEDLMSGSMNNEITGSVLTGTFSGETTGMLAMSGDETTGIVELISKDQAHNSLLAIFKESKKNLATALKAKNSEATQILYKSYKDTISLLKTLANTEDMSTIPDVKAQIDTLQQSLDQAHSSLNGASTNNAQS